MYNNYFLKEFQIKLWKLLKYRIISYPLSAASTMLSLSFIEKEYTNEQFNLCLKLWMLLGTSTILEYSFGVKIAKNYALNKDKSENFELLRKSLYRFIIIALTIGLVISTNPIKDFIIIEFFKISNTKNLHEYWIFFGTFFLSGFSQLLNRRLQGLQRVASIQIYQTTGMVISSILVYAVTTLNLNFSLAIMVFYSSLYISIFLQLFYEIFLKIFIFRKTAESKEYIQKDTTLKELNETRSYKYLLISFFSTINFLIPRSLTDLHSHEQTRIFLLTLTSINVVQSIVSAVSPMLWIDGIKDGLDQKNLFEKFKFMMVITIISIPLYSIISLLVFFVLGNIHMLINNVLTFLIGAFLSCIYILQILPSNLLSRNQFQNSLIKITFLTSIAYIVASFLKIYEISSNFTLIYMLGISIIFSLIPSYMIYFRIEKS